jgi:diguanylate cyclase (GGDEF)-like protein
VETSKDQGEGRQLAIRRLQLFTAPSEEPIDRITRLVTRALDVPAAVFSIVELERQYFKSRAGFQIPETSHNVGFCSHAMLLDDPLVVEDASQDERFRDSVLVTGQPGVRFYAGVAIRSPELLPVGALCALDVRPRQISEETLNALIDLGALLERELLLRTLTRNDPLTGLQNRSYCELELDREWRRARRGRQPITVLLIDVDRLGEFNDTFGHAHGDRALREISELLMRTFRRSTDLLIRVGGDRILVLLPDTELEEGLRMAETTREEVENLGLGNPKAASALTLSIGCAGVSSESGYQRGYDSLIRDATSALEQAKNSGRNRVVEAATRRAAIEG